jgi:putative flippase GtrA
MIKEIFVNFWEYKFFRFIIVGIINTIFGYSLFALLIYLKFHYSIAVLISTIIGVLFNFKTTGRIVFKNDKSHLLFKFILVYVFTYFLNIGLIKLLTYTKFSMYLIGAICIVPMSVISFFLNKVFVFRI